MQVSKICVYCGGEYTKGSRTYCSGICRKKSAQMKRRFDAVEAMVGPEMMGRLVEEVERTDRNLDALKDWYDELFSRVAIVPASHPVTQMALSAERTAILKLFTLTGDSLARLAPEDPTIH
jgi:hypothetical protein